MKENFFLFNFKKPKNLIKNYRKFYFLQKKMI
jgi:hypothetical protein